MLPLENHQIASAFRTIASLTNPAASEEAAIEWSKLKSLLVNVGEKMSASDLDSFLIALLGHSAIREDEIFTANEFAEKLLGFEDFY